MKHRARDYVEYGLVRGLTAIVGRLPHRAALALGWALARLVFLFARRRMRKFERRIGQVFGDKQSPRERRRVLWLAWRNLVFNGIESMRTPLVTREWINRVVDQRDVHLLFENMKEGRGAVLAVPHMGNWELAGVGMQLLGARLMIIVRRQRNMLTYEWLNRVRASAGLESFLREAHSFTGIVKGLQHGKVLAILPDLRAKAQFVAVPFLGHPAQIPAGMAAFARDAGVPIIPAYVVREGWTRHRWKGFPPIHPDPALDRDTDVERMTRYVIGVFDQAIREHPDQYYWFNGRWVLGEEPR